MEISRITYLGGLRTESRHLKSGEIVISDAPTDNQGKGQAFSPTDLLATSLGSCMLTIMGIAANNHGFELGDVHIRVEKHMAQAPRRVEKIILHVDMLNPDLNEHQRKLLETAGRNCPVAKSLHPDLVQDIRFSYH